MKQNKTKQKPPKKPEALKDEVILPKDPQQIRIQAPSPDSLRAPELQSALGTFHTGCGHCCPSSFILESSSASARGRRCQSQRESRSAPVYEWMNEWRTCSCRKGCWFCPWNFLSDVRGFICGDLTTQRNVAQRHNLKKYAESQM